MINYNGYYLTLSKKSYDKRENKIICAINAYRFFKNQEYKVYSIIEYIDRLVDFSLEDLNSDKALIGTYEIDTNRLTMHPKNQFAADFQLEILNSDRLYDPRYETDLYFVSWLKHNSLNTDERLIIESVLPIHD